MSFRRNFSHIRRKLFDSWFLNHEHWLWKWQYSKFEFLEIANCFEKYQLSNRLKQMIETNYSKRIEMIYESLSTIFFRFFCVFFSWMTRSFSIDNYRFHVIFWYDHVSNLNTNIKSIVATIQFEKTMYFIFFCLFSIRKKLFVLKINFFITSLKFLKSNIFDCMKSSNDSCFFIKNSIMLSISS